MEEFEGWYKAEHRRVLSACLALAGSRDVAIEGTDEAFARAMERWSSVSQMTSPGAWVQVVALNHVRRLLRRRRWERRPLTQLGEGVESPVPNPELWAAVRRLPPRQQTVVVLRYVGDLPEVEIAAAIGTSRGGVARTLHDARARLRQSLTEQQPVTPEASR